MAVIGARTSIPLRLANSPLPLRDLLQFRVKRGYVGVTAKPFGDGFKTILR